MSGTSSSGLGFSIGRSLFAAKSGAATLSSHQNGAPEVRVSERRPYGPPAPATLRIAGRYLALSFRHRKAPVWGILHLAGQYCVKGAAMADVRFFHRAGPFTLGEIAALVAGGEPLGSRCARRCPFAGHRVLFEKRRPRRHQRLYRCFGTWMRSSPPEPAQSSSAASSHSMPARSSRLIFVKDPRLAYAQVGKLFYPAPVLEPGDCVCRGTVSIRAASIGAGVADRRRSRHWAQRRDRPSGATSAITSSWRTVFASATSADRRQHDH